MPNMRCWPHYIDYNKEYHTYIAFCPYINGGGGESNACCAHLWALKIIVHKTHSIWSFVRIRIRVSLYTFIDSRTSKCCCLTFRKKNMHIRIILP